MKNHISSMVAASIVTVLIGVIPVSGQQRTSWFSNPFTVSSGSESLPSSGGGSTMQAVTLVTPSRFSIDGASARSHWGVGYQPEFDIRYGTGQTNSWNHSADASFGHLFSRRTKLDFGHTFVKSSDPARTFTDNIFVLPQNNFRENATAMTLSHQVSSRTTLNFRFDNTITRMSTVADSSSTILNQYGVAGTTGVSQRLGQRHKLTLSYSLLKFSPYRFGTAVDAAQFVASIPTITAGIARFGSDLAVSASRSSPTPTGLVGGGQEPGASPAPQPSNPTPTSTTPTVTGNVSVGGQDVGLTVPSVTSSPVGTASVAIAPSPTPTVGVTTAIPSVTATVPVPTVTATVPVPTVTATVPVPTVTATAPVPTVTATVPIPTVTATVPVPTVTATVPVPAPAPVPVVSSPVVPLVPSISVSVINPTVPLVGVVTPVPTTTSTPNPTCQLVNNTCITTTNVTTPSGVTSALQTTTSTITKLSVAPTSAGPTSAAPAAAAPTAAATPDPTVPPVSSAGPEAATSSPTLLGNPFHIVSATYTYAKDPGLLFEMSGGVMRDREMSYLLSMQVERRFDRLWIAGGFQRFLSFFGTLPFQGTQQAGVVALPNGVQGRSLFSALTGRVGGKINRRTQLEMSVSLSKSTANFVAHDLNSAIARGRITYALTDRVGIFADVDSFYENGSDVAAAQYSRQRYFGGVQVHFTPAAGQTQKAGN